MDVRDTRKCNLMNSALVARYVDAPASTFVHYYEELLADRAFLRSLNRRMADVVRKWGFVKGIFRKGKVSSIDWFAFERVLIYVLIRHFKPQMVLETGVFYGGNSAFALAALARNRCGRMVSIDFPDAKIRKSGSAASRHVLVGDSELYDPDLRPGFLVPPLLHDRWDLIEGDSLELIPRQAGRFDFYIHDSDHSMRFLSRELAAAWKKLSPNAVMLVDDIDWSNAFYAFCARRRLYPLLVTDNGKDDLRVRTGIAMRNHPRNCNATFT
jgi:predicted O-methyltransferase YrrM